MLPKIPTDKLYFQIGEVSELCNVEAHTLREWEKHFDQLKGLKRKSNRRVYTPDDIYNVRLIRRLVRDEGYSIDGARKFLADHKASNRLGLRLDPDPNGDELEQVIDELEDIQRLLTN